MKNKLYEIREVKQLSNTERVKDRTLAVAIYKQFMKSRVPFSKAINTMRGKTIKDPYLVGALREQLRDWKSRFADLMNKDRPYKKLRRVYQGQVLEFEVADGIDGAKDALRAIKERVREIRQRNRHVPTNDYIAFKIYHRKPLELLKEFQSKRLQIQKRPNDQAEYVGIEIECIMPRGIDLTPLAPFSKYIEVGSDSSIDYKNNESGTEVRACMRRDEIREVLPPIMQTLRSMGARVNTSCGLHVHLDQRHNKEPEKAFIKLVRSLGLLYTIVPESRRRNRYCKRNRHSDFGKAVHGDRYKAINASAFHRYKTIEVRLFGGTLEETKIINWIETLFAIAYGEILGRCPKSFDTAMKYWKLSPENLAWLKDRLAKFSSLNAGMPVSEHETEPNQVLLDEYETADGEMCENCDQHMTDCTCDV